MTASGRRSEANDVSLLWRHSSRSRSWQLECAYKRPFLTVFGEFGPQNVVGYRVDPKKALLTSQRVLWAIMRQTPWTGHFSRRVRGKIFKKKIRPYISRICPDAPLRSISTNFGLRVSILFYSKTSRLGRRKCQSTTRAPNNIVSVNSTME